MKLSSHLLLIKNFMQVYSRYPFEKPQIERVSVKVGLGLM